MGVPRPRHQFRRRRSGVTRLRALPVTAGVLGVLLVVTPGLSGVGLPAAAAAAGPVTFADHVYAATAVGPPSADKPQSKLWFQDGSWWAVMLGSASVNIFELGADHVWHDTGTVVDPRVSSTADALWSGGQLYVASRTAGAAGAIEVSRYSYSATTRRYSQDSGFPVTVGGAGGSESVTIDRDTLGRLWVTFTRASSVWVAHSTVSDTSWTAPFLIPGVDTAVSADDISSLISLGGKIAVMWSDQASAAFRFAVHQDTDPDTVWSMETPFAGTRIADDHLNLKSLLGDDQGRLYAAVKTSLGDNPADPLTAPGIVVLTRSVSGVWTAATAAYRSLLLTRPQLALDRTNRQLILLQSDEGGGSVYYKTAPLGVLTDFSFDPASKGAPFITWPGATINDVSTAKDPVDATSGLVAIATDAVAHRYYHAELTLLGPAAAPIPGTPPGPGAPTSATGAVTCLGLAATIVGTARADRLTGTSGNDVIVGLAGSDTIDGRGGRDTICAGAGNDSVTGGTGNDRLFGGSGRDVLRGGGGSDVIEGQRGNDRGFGEAGADRITENATSDGADRYSGGPGNDRLAGGTGPDHLTGGPGRDAINGGPGADTIDGGTGRDVCTSPRRAAGCNA